MKKLISFVLVLMMCATMLPTSFAAESFAVKTGQTEYNVAPGETFEVPIYFSETSGASATFGILEAYVKIPDGFTYEVVNGVLTSDDVGADPDNNQILIIYRDTNVTFAKDAVAFTVKATAPQATGAYEMSIYDVILCDSINYDQYMDVAQIGATINVQNESSGDDNEGDTSGDIAFEGEVASTTEEYLVGPKHTSYNFVSGSTKEIPVYFAKTDNADAKFSIMEAYIEIPEGFTYEFVAGVLSTDDVTPDPDNNRILIMYRDTDVTFAKDAAAFTLRLTAPSEVGSYEMPVYDVILCDANYDQIMSVDTNSAMLNVVSGQGVPDTPTTGYTVTFKADGAIVETVEVEEGATVASIPSAPAKEGYVFVKWIADGAEFTTDTVINSELVVEAEYEAIHYVAIFKAEGQNDIVEDVVYGETIGAKMPANPEKAGFQFVGWFTENNVEITAATVVKGNIDATAKFVENAQGGGSGGNDFVEGDVATTNEDYLVGPKHVSYTVKAESTFEVPVYFAKVDGGNALFSILEAYVKIPEGFTYELVDGILTSAEVSADPFDNTVLIIYNDVDTTFTSGDPAFTLKLTAPAINGTYNMPVYDVILCDANYDQIMSVDTNSADLIVVGGQEPPKEFTVNFVAEGNAVGEAVIVMEGNSVGTLPDAPAVEGKDFYRWEDENGNEVTAATVVNSDMTITAVYKTQQFSVKFVNGTESVDSIVDYGSTVTLPTAPEKEGHNFIGWFEGNTEIKADTVVKANITAEAKFEAKEYNVKFVSFGETLSESKIKYGKKVYLPATPTAKGYRFNGWADENGKAWSQDTVVTGDMTFTADWTANKYAVEFIAEYETLNGPKKDTLKDGEVEFDSEIIFPADPVIEGYNFLGWYKDDVKIEDGAILEDDKAITIKAKLEKKVYSLLFNSYRSEVPVEVEYLGTIAEEDIPEAVMEPGYRFVKWVVSNDNLPEEEWADFDPTKPVTGDLNIVAIDEEITTDIEVVGADGKAIDTVIVPYGTAIADIAKAIDDAITVNVVEDNEVKEADVKFDALDIKDRVATVTIAYGDYSKEINVAYETKDAYIEAYAQIMIPYMSHNGKTDEEIAKYVYDNAGVAIYDKYGIVNDAADYTVVITRDDDTKATAKITCETADSEAELTINVTLQPLGSNSTASGTVVRPSTGVVTGGGSANKPSTDEPATDDPATDDPATDEPATDDPATDDPATDDPATDDPATDAPAADVPFTDVKADDWALEAIKDLHSRGIISGDESKALRPDSGITREEVSKIVLNVKGIEVDADATIDAADAGNVSDWAKGFVATAIKEGLLKGYEDGTIQSGKVVTRAEFAAILVRAIGATAEFTASTFTDVGDAWYAADVECAKNLGIVTGYEDGSFQGDKPVTRREAFAMAQRVIKLIEALENN